MSKEIEYWKKSKSGNYRPVYTDGTEGPVQSEVPILIEPWSGDKSASKYDAKKWKDFAAQRGFKPKTGTKEEQNKEFQEFLHKEYPEIVTKAHSGEGYGMPKATGKMYDALLGVRWDKIMDAVETEKPLTPATGPKKAKHILEVEENIPTTPPYAQHLDPNAVAVPNTGGLPPWYLQDMIGTAGAITDLFGVKAYQPWQATPDLHLPRTTLFYDPERELASHKEDYRMAADTMAQFQSPQALAGNLSGLAGETAKRAADTLGRYHNLNVGVANQRDVQNAGMLNQYAQNRANQATDLYDKYTIAQQQFDNSKKQARQNVRNSIVQGITNAAYTDNLNQMYPQYAINPLTGGTMYYRNPRGLTPSYNQEKDLGDEYAKVLEEFGKSGIDNTTALAIAKQRTGMKENPMDPWMDYLTNRGVVPTYPG